MGAIGRACTVVNLDPANDHTSYKPGVDVRSLVKLEEIMKEDNLGPNGGILYALEELEHNFEWLEEKLKEFSEDYILFDCPDPASHTVTFKERYRGLLGRAVGLLGEHHAADDTALRQTATHDLDDADVVDVEGRGVGGEDSEDSSGADEGSSRGRQMGSDDEDEGSLRKRPKLIVENMEGEV